MTEEEVIKRLKELTIGSEEIDPKLSIIFNTILNAILTDNPVMLKMMASICLGLTNKMMGMVFDEFNIIENLRNPFESDEK